MAVHPQVQAILDAAESRPRPESLEEARQNYAETSLTYVGEAEDVAQVRDVHLDEGARLRLYVPAGDVRGAILWIHGGGWIMGTLEAYDALCRALANRTGAVVGSVDYRLAPEHPYPEPVQDVERALAALQREAPGPYAIAGDSAGGNLAAVVARRHRGDLRFQLLVYPVTDAAMATDSYRRYGADATYRVAKEEMAFCWEQYAPGRIGQGPDASPLRAPDLTGVPPALVIVAEYDPLTDEGLDYAERLQAAGVEARTSVYEGMVHGFFRWRGAVDAAGAAMDEASAALRAALQA